MLNLKKMQTPATYEDVNLLLRLYEMRREEKMRQARDYFLGQFNPDSVDEFKQMCPHGTKENAHFRQFITYWEMVASFITAGVLNENLFFQSGREMLVAYERVKPMLGDMRAMYQDPTYLLNLEQVGEHYIEFMKKKGPDTYEAFLNRVGKPPKKQA